MQKVEITLTDHQVDILTIHAMQSGVHLNRYIKRLIVNVVEQQKEKKKYPIYTLNKKSERIADKGYEDYKAGKARRIHKSFSEILE